MSELDRIRRRELDHYVQQAIDEAIMAARTRPAAVPRPDGPPWEVADAATQLDEEMYALALGATTKSFVHELRPSIGLARLALSHRDLASAVGHVERMDRLLDAMEQMAHVAVGGEEVEFDLGKLVGAIAADYAANSPCGVEVADAPLINVEGHRGAVELIVKNAIANACESTAELRSDASRPVVVSCGRTDRDAWVAVHDDGLGLAAGIDPFALGVSRKKDHDGVGLALAQQAARSLGATIALVGREGGGATFHFAWPQAVV